MENTSSSPLLDRTTASTSVTQVPMSDQTNLSAPAPGGTDAHKGTRFDPVASTPKPPAPYSNPECEPSQDDSESTRGNPAEVEEDQYNPTKLEPPSTPDYGGFPLELHESFSTSSSQQIVDLRAGNIEDNENNNQGYERAKRESKAQGEIRTQRRWRPSAGTGFMRSFFGFIEDPMDAVTVVEACITGKLSFFQGHAPEMAYYEAKSGDVIVIPESNRVVRRWRDNIQWSPSRAFGPFLLYRQVEPIPKNTVTSIPLKYSFRRVQSNVAALEPTFSAKTLKAGTRVMENGLTKRTISLTGSDGQKHRVISYYTPNDVIEMCQREADGFEPAYGEEVFQRPSKCPMLIDAMKSKAMNLNQLLKQQNLYQESTFKSFRIASESPKSEAWPDELDTRSSKRQKKEASKLHMPQEESGAHQSQTPVNEILSRRPPHPQPQPSKSSVPCEPRTFSANANPQVNSNSFHSRTLYYPYLQPPHIMGRPPIIHTYPLKRSPTHESFQPQSQYHQQPKPDEAPVVYNLPVGVSLPDLAPRSNCLRQVPPRPSYFHRPPHLQHHSAPPNEPYYPTMHYPTMQGTYGPYLPYHAFQGPPLGYTPPHPYGAPPPLTYPGYVSMPPAGMHVHGAGLGRQQPVYFVGPSQLGPPSLPRNSVKVGHDFQDE